MSESRAPNLLFNMSCRPQAEVRLRGTWIAVAWRIEVVDATRWEHAKLDPGALARPLSARLVAEVFDLPCRSRIRRSDQLAELAVISQAFLDLPAVAPARRDPFCGLAATLDDPELALAILGRVRGRAFVKSSCWRLTASDLERPTVVFLPPKWKP